MQTLTKAEVIALLGKSKRTIDSYMANGTLAYHYIQGPNGKQAEFYLDDVQRVKAHLDAPIFPDPKRLAPVNTAPAVVAPPAAPAPTNGAVWESLPAKLAKLASVAEEFNAAHAPRAVYVSLKDAVKITGLSAATIRALAEGDGVRTMAYGGGVRYRRADLEKL